MSINVAGFIAVGLSVGAFQLSYAGLRKRTRCARWAWTGAFGFLAIPAILFAVYYLHVLPEREWFYTLRSWRGAEFLAVFLGCAGGAVASLLPRGLTMLPLGASILLGLVPYLKPILNPLPDGILIENWQGDVCLQSTASTCGPASVCTVLRRLGVDSSERATARAAESTAGGTEAWYLARYVRRKGCEARFRFGTTFSPSFGLPAVVGVRLGQVGHFIAVLDVSGDQVTFADPTRGRETMPLAQFQKRYEFTGFHMIVSKRE